MPNSPINPPKAVRLVAVGSFLLLLGLLFAQFTNNVPGVEAGAETERGRSEKINLALRRTADQLLRAAGDSTSRIPAVQQPNPTTFRIALGRAFDYDQLPDALRQSLQLHNITGTYTVAVLDSLTRELQLGYSVSDLTGNKPIPCGGRSMKSGSYVLQLTFDAPVPVEKKTPLWPLLVIGGLLMGGLLLVWHRLVQVRSPADGPVAETPDQLRFGHSSLDVANQTLTTVAEQHKLTYREAKLLRVLVAHPNQLLERDQIMKLVWEDEGITVGRSLDVFVSRLRKLLHSDSTLKIAAVHGVGYRLEVRL